MHSRLVSSLQASSSSPAAGMPPRRGRRGSAARAVAAPPPPATLPWEDAGLVGSRASLPLQLRSVLPLAEPVPAAATAAAAASAAGGDGVDADAGAAGAGAAEAWPLRTGLALTWLGTSSAAPTLVRNVSCTLVRMPGSFFLVDCGEGTHRQLQRTGIDVSEAEAILITHLHGDHCFGLGSTLALLTAARAAAAAAGAAPRRPLQVVGPPGVAELLRAMLVLAGGEWALEAPVAITELVMTSKEAHAARPVGARSLITVTRLAPEAAPLAPEAVAHLTRTRLRAPRGAGGGWESFRAAPGLAWALPCSAGVLRAAQLQHRVPCWGYCYEEAAPGGAAAALPGGAGGGGDARKVVILGDTMDSTAMAPLALGADVVAHEATFQAGMEALAARAQHSTAWMAGEFAAAVRARALVLTHFSSRYGASDVGEHEHARGRGRGGGAAAAAADRGGDGCEVDEAEAAAVVESLVAEAGGRFAGGPVYAARDFWTFHVPRRRAAVEGEEGGEPAQLSDASWVL